MANIDLHGRTWSESLVELIDAYNRTLSSGSPSETLDIVHGYGSSGAGGTTRVRVRSFLATHSHRLEYVAGEDADANPGHTVVLPIEPLPEVGDLLAEEVLEYCETPRTQSKITGKFRRHGDPRVMQAIRTLEKQGRLRTVARGRNKAYEAI
ncbi:MAG: Smr/MutS family protein [Chloroflexota bacterium]|nr:Smr/MutS family protein [Chloroflexota bacterium]MDE2959331.1 Smr/MutS family protein [Chloroflexota bacterium]